MRDLRRLAYEELNLAIDQAGAELPSDWLSGGDRDLDALRAAAEPEWDLILLRQTGDSARPLESPGAAWGEPRRRRDEWFGLGFVLVLLGVTTLLLALSDEGWLVLAGIVYVVGAALVLLSGQHRVVFLVAGALPVLTIAWLVLTDPSVPGWLVTGAFVVLLFAAGLGAMYRGQLAHTEATDADAQAVALWKQRRAPR
jgi:hypothetical protein